MRSTLFSEHERMVWRLCKRARVAAGRVLRLGRAWERVAWGVGGLGWRRNGHRGRALHGAAGVRVAAGVGKECCCGSLDEDGSDIVGCLARDVKQLHPVIDMFARTYTGPASKTSHALSRDDRQIRSLLG